MNKVERCLNQWAELNNVEKSDKYWVTAAGAIAFVMHEGINDKGGQPYYNHPASIVKAMVDLGFGYEYRSVAYLHDVIEDTDADVDFLRKIGFPNEIIDAVVAMTHNDNESYFDYVVRASKNKIAKQVKMFDLKHNSGLDRMLFDPESMEMDLRRMAKYVIAYQFLSGKIDEKEFEKRIKENNAFFKIVLKYLS